MGPFILMLLTGIGCMSGATVYGKRKKIFYQGKHLKRK